MSFNDSRLKYINTGKRVSMSENFEFALSHVKDGFIMFIGDDDGVVPNSLEYVNDVINDTSCKAIVSHNAFYTWPDSHGISNRLYWSHRSGYEVRDTKKWIERYLRFNMQYTFDLPGAYCGFVHKSLFEKVSKDGVFFRSSTPDAYSALAIAFSTTKYVYSHSAFAVHGSSSNSNGGSFLSKEKGKEARESKLFKQENTIPFHKDIVFTKAFRTSSLEAYLQFADTFPEFTKNYQIDWKLFLSYVLTERTNNTKEEIENAVKKMCEIHNVKYKEIQEVKRNRFENLSFMEIVDKVINRIKLRLKRQKNKIDNTLDYGVNNIYDAVLLLKFFQNIE